MPRARGNNGWPIDEIVFLVHARDLMTCISYSARAELHFVDVINVVIHKKTYGLYQL